LNTINSHRKPLGNPHPQASNLALAVVLLVVVFLQAIFNAWQDISTSRVMASIRGMLPADVVVLRDAVQTTVPAASLVPGDLVQIVMGQKVPADVRLIDASGDLKFDRSVLTGEVCHCTHLQFFLLVYLC
jgi:sodium/potassium-transporting ATPase subunit alpha